MSSRISKIHVIPDQTIGKALTSYTLHVPPNQREYSWKDKHVEDLFRDFDDAIRLKAAEYFLGSVVVIKDEGDESLSVVDGQQRLATSLILLAAIRDYFEQNSLPGVDAKKFQGEYILSEGYRQTEKPTPHLFLSDTDRQYFEKRVLLPPSNAVRKATQVPAKRSAARPPASHKLIDKAAEIAAKKVKSIVSSFSEERRADELDEWVEFLLKKARVIWVEVPDESSAYLIFETMNDRELELSASDLIKNYLFGKAGSDTNLETIKLNWSSMVNVLNTVAKTEVKDFVRHYWISAHGVIRSQDLFEAIRNDVKNDNDAITMSERLSSSAASYTALLTHGHPQWAKYPETVRKSISTLNILGVEQIRPLLMTALENLNTKEMAKLLMTINWSVRLLVSGIQGSGAVETAYGNAALGVTEKKYRTAAEIAAAMGRYIPADQLSRRHSLRLLSVRTHWLDITCERWKIRLKGNQNRSWQVTRILTSI
jgi:hypothetical protein